jgi:Leucine-rich repeat (LRR) protein
VSPIDLLVGHAISTQIGEGLQGMVQLEELYLAGNAITDASGLEGLSNLNTLDLSSNQLTSTSGLESLKYLVDLWMNSNVVSSFEAVEPLKNLPALDCLYLEHNPIYKDFEYRKRLTQMLPTLTQIDATAVAPR